MSKLCIIPARGGSKRIPRKNIKDFLGKPIIAYSIEAAINSGLFEEVMVSTDDTEIADVAKKYGAKVPFLRSKKNADDFSTLSDVEEEVILSYSNIQKKFNNICIILPTAPFVTSKMLIESLYTFEKGEFDNLRPLVMYSYPIQRALYFNKEGGIEMREPAERLTRSQDLKPTYHDAGLFYWSKPLRGLKGNKRGGFEVNEIETQDIDSTTDWRLAEIKFKITNNLD